MGEGMKLNELLQPWLDLSSPACDILGMQNDSRHVRPGDLFIAYPGAVADGRKYIAQALQQGAAAVVYDPIQLPNDVVLPAHVPCIPIPKLAHQLAALASRFYHHPSEQLAVMGVTGTNGKTTIAYQLTQAHQLLGRPTTYMGTLGHGQIAYLEPLHNTTPDALCVQRLLAQDYERGIQQICMEVSSHALAEHRVDHIAFREAIYTNLSHEHLDYHHTLAEYARAKALLFARPSLEWVILNLDDEYVQSMVAAVQPGVRQFTYGIHHHSALVRATDYHLHIQGSRFTVESPWGRQVLTIPSLGLFNIYNSLAVYTSLLANDYAMADVADVMANLQSSPGRMEIVAHSPYVIVDYAHTPAALENVLKTVMRLKSSDAAKIWVVFGCGGDRDKTKRPLMGKIASEYATHVIITSDNPRHEDPGAIMQDILVGIPQGTPVTSIADRREAIHYAITAAARDDIVLIAGKGHEDYQIIGNQRLVFSDQDEVRRLMP